MKNIRKILVLLLAATMVLILGACGKSAETLPENKSSSVGLYVGVGADGNTAVVNRYNNPSADFSVDKDGNILNKSGDIFIAAANTEKYVPLTAFTATCSRQFPVALPLSGTGAAEPVTVDIQVNIAPASATCREIMIVSDNTSVAEVPISAYTINPASDAAVVTVTLKGAGSANITIKSSSAEGEALAATVNVSATVSGSIQAVDPSDPTGTTTPNGTTTDPNGTTTDPNGATTNTNTNQGTGRVGYVTGDGVNFRRGPSTDSEIITAYYRGQQITIYSISNGWASVSVDGQSGYISATYVSYDKPAATTPAPTTTPDPFAGTGNGGASGNDPFAGEGENEDVAVVIPSA